MTRSRASTVGAAPLPAASHELRQTLLAWYDRHRRTLPWRAGPGRAADAYRVLVSEVMLQQTTVATVAGRYQPFLDRFPSLQALAAAPLEAVLHAWQGLGYYHRAKALHACAREVAERLGGVLPTDVEALGRLPGLGPYTAAAIAAIAFGRAAVPVDGNAQRVLARLAGIETPLPASRAAIASVAVLVASNERAGDFAQALMDLGALVCTPRKPLCLACPWSPVCVARRQGLAEILPRRAARSPRPERSGVAFLLRRTDGAVLFRRRGLAGLLPGMIELPSTPWDRAELVPDPLRHVPAAADWHFIPGSTSHVFTHFALTMRVAAAEAVSEIPGLWVAPEAFGSLALPTLTRKLLRHAGLTAPAIVRAATRQAGGAASAKAAR